MIPVPAAAVRSSKSAADGEHMKIKLQTVIDAIEQASDAYTMLYDTKTNETVYLPDAWVTGETDEALAALVENEPKRFLHFPTKYDIHEYSIMDSFVDYLPPGRMKKRTRRSDPGQGCIPALQADHPLPRHRAAVVRLSGGCLPGAGRALVPGQRCGVRINWKLYQEQKRGSG